MCILEDSRKFGPEQNIKRIILTQQVLLPEERIVPAFSSHFSLIVITPYYG